MYLVKHWQMYVVKHWQMYVVKHWQFYLAIIALIVLINQHIKEGNEPIAPDAEVLNKPVELINTMKGLISGQETNDMVENKNLNYELSQVKTYLANAKQILAADQATLEKTRNTYDALNGLYINKSTDVKACNNTLTKETAVYSNCNLKLRPKADDAKYKSEGTLQGMKNQLDKCNATLAQKIADVNRCKADVINYNR